MEHIHDYKRVKEDKNGFQEICKTCKHRISFTKAVGSGRIDNRRYLKEHKRNFVQPFGRTGNAYRRIYGNPDPHKFEYKPKHIAKREAEKGWKEIGNDKSILKDKKFI